MKIKYLPLAGVVFCSLFTILNSVFAQGTAFTYQGRLQDGSASAGGGYDFRFAIFDSSIDGNLIAGPLTNTAVAVSNGLFTVALDFGSGVFSGGARWLELAVRTGTNDFTLLSPRQPVTPTPYALLATAAGNVAASNISGTVPDARLSTNVPLLVAGILTNNTTGTAATATTAAYAAIAGTATNGTWTGNLAVYGDTTGYPPWPSRELYWDNFQRANTTISTGLTPAPSISPITGTNYTYFAEPAYAGGTNCSYITNGYVAVVDRASTNHNWATYPTVNLGFKPTYYGGRYRYYNTGIAGAANYPSICLILSPNSNYITGGSLHIGCFPTLGCGVGFWGPSGLSNVTPSYYTPPDFHPPLQGQDFSFEVIIRGNTLVLNYNNSFFQTTDTRVSQYGGNYLTFEIYDDGGSAAPVYQIQQTYAFATHNPADFPTNTFTEVFNMTNSTNQFGGTFTGNGSGLTNLNISVAFLPTNALSKWPAAAASAGGAALVNSNGTVYLLTSTPGSTVWTATNKIAP